jgi:3-hydroxyacyl-[acyl-carrier-protein] dehydratase
VVSKDLIIDLSQIDAARPIAEIDEIRRYNRQRFEMEQLTAIVHIDSENHICVGYKDVTNDEFWVRGHMPGLPLMPGVIMCEAAAQLASYYTQKFGLLGNEVVGFGGLENVRFRDPVVPGDRLFIITGLLRVRRGRMVVCRFQGVVKNRIVFEGILKGIPLPVDALQSAAQKAVSAEVVEQSVRQSRPRP